MQKTMNEYYCYLSKAITLHEACKVLGIELIPSGDDYICRCFFHDDEHPSMHLYTESNSYYCFQCGENGNLFSFIKGKLGCSFLESVQWIEKHYPEVLSEKPTIGEQNIDGYEIARNFYCVMSEEEEQGLSVFVKDRKFTRKLLNDAEIYYAKGRKLQHLLNKKDQFIEQTNKLEEKQLLNRVPNQMHHINAERYEDYFKADRIMITLRNDRNEIIGFAGRSIVEQDKPKYLFTKRLDKKHLLYRLNHVKRKYSKDRKLQTLYIVEGIFDALRLEKK